MPGIINWGTPAQTPSSPQEFKSGVIDWGSLYNNDEQYKQKVEQAFQTERQHLQTIQQSKGINNDPALLDLQARAGAGQISRDDFTKQLPKFQNNPAPFKITPKTIAQQTGESAKAIGKGFVQSEQTAATGVARVLPGGTNDLKAQQQQAASADKNVKDTIALQKSGKISKASAQAIIAANADSATEAQQQQADTIKAMPSKGQVAAGFAGTAADILTGGTLPELKGVGTVAKTVRAAETPVALGVAAGSNAAAGGGDKKQIIENALAGAAFPLALKGLTTAKKAFVDGPQELLKNSKAAYLTDAGREANKPKPIPVSGGGEVDNVAVKTPVHPQVQEVRTADKLTVRTPQRMSEEQFTKEFNKLSKSYDKDTSQLGKSVDTLAPQQLKTANDALEARYQGQLHDLLDRYHNPQLSEPVAPKPLKVAQPKVETPAPAKPIAVNTPKAEAPTVMDKATQEAAAQSTPSEAAAETVKVPRDQLPVGTGPAKTSRLEARMQTTMHNLTDEQKSGLSTYKQMNKQENISAAAMYVDKHPEEAMRVLRGELDPPKGIAHNSVFLAMDAKGMDNPELARRLASLRSTRYGQEISLLTEANANSPTKHMADLKNVRIEAKGGESKVRTQRSAITKEIKRSISKPTKQDWSDFVESLRC